MSTAHFLKAELAAALARGVRQCVVVCSRPLFQEALKASPDQNLRVFTVDEQLTPCFPAASIPAQFACEALATTLEKSDFDKRKATLFVWLGGPRYRTAEAVIAGLAFIASLPVGSAVVFDYAVERISGHRSPQTALDGLASRLCLTGTLKYLIQPQAVAAMLRGLGFQQMVDLAQSGGHLVSAIV